MGELTTSSLKVCWDDARFDPHVNQDLYEIISITFQVPDNCGGEGLQHYAPGEFKSNYNKIWQCTTNDSTHSLCQL